MVGYADANVVVANAVSVVAYADANPRKNLSHENHREAKTITLRGF